MSEVVNLEGSEEKTELGKDSSHSTVEEEEQSNTPQNKAPWVFTEKRKESLIKANKARIEKKNLSNNLKLDYVEAKKEIQKAYQEASKKLVLEKKLEMSVQKKEKPVKQEEKEESIPIVSVIPIVSNPPAVEKVEKIPEIVKVKEMEEEEDKIDIKKFIKQLIQEEKGKKGRKTKEYDSDTSEEEPPKKSKKRKPTKRPIPPSDSEESEEEEEPPPKKTAAPARQNPYLYQSGYLPTLMRGKRSGCIF